MSGVETPPRDWVVSGDELPDRWPFLMKRIRGVGLTGPAAVLLAVFAFSWLSC